MELNELIKMLESMISCKALYSEQIGSEFLYMRCRPDPKSCVIEQAAKELKRLAEIQEILGDTYDLGHLRELVEADKAGRCVVLPFGGFADKDGENALKSAMNACFYHNNPVTRYIADAVAEKLAREEAEAALEKMKEVQHE